MPNESCAILYGKIEGAKARVEDVFLADNIDKSSVSFAISNEELLAAYKRAERDNTQVIAIFHSHPGSEARPSPTDRKFMESNPVVWVIYSGTDGDFRAYVLEQDGAGAGGGGLKEIQVPG